MELRVQLPNGSTLVARNRDNPAYPGIEICIIEPNDESDEQCDIVVVVEHDIAGGGVYVRAYTADDDEPAYSAAYSYNGLKED